MEGIQTLLIVVVIALTVLLFVVGIQVILIISDLRRSVKRLNTILEDGIWGGGLLRPDRLSGVIEMFKKKKQSVMQEKGNMQDRQSEEIKEI